jgi:hypothetical protein
LQYFLLALFLSFTYFDPDGHNRKPAQKITVLSVSRFMTTLTSLPFLANYLAPDRRLLREGLNGVIHRPSILILAKYTVYLSLREVLFGVYTAIVYPLTALRPGMEHAMLFLVTLWAHQFAKSAVGFLISACFSSAPVKSHFTYYVACGFHTDYSGAL